MDNAKYTARLRNPGRFMPVPGKRNFNRSLRALKAAAKVDGPSLHRSDLDKSSIAVDGTLFGHAGGVVKVVFARPCVGGKRSEHDVPVEVYYRCGSVQSRDAEGHWDSRWVESVAQQKRSVLAKLKPSEKLNAKRRRELVASKAAREAPARATALESALAELEGAVQTAIATEDRFADFGDDYEDHYVY